MTENHPYDIAVIGSGPGGYVAAIRAAQLGMKSIVIEKNRPGGVCLNIGCIPTKSIINSARIFQSIEALTAMGVECKTDKFDYHNVIVESQNVAGNLSKGIEYLLKKNKVDLLVAEAHLDGDRRIVLDSGDTITADNIIVATGARPRVVNGLEFDGNLVLSSDDALNMERLPDRLCIVGGGAIGCEFAYIMNSFGVDVHLIEMMDQLLPREDSDIARELEKSFVQQGISVHTNSQVSIRRKQVDSATVTVKSKDSEFDLEVDQVLVVTGRVPNTEMLGLESLGIKTENGFIVTHDYYQTDVSGVFAIGDVIGGPMLAHSASREGHIAVEFIKGLNPLRHLSEELIPRAVYCEPQVASFGLTEQDARNGNIAYSAATFPFRGIGKAVAINSTEGMIKILTDQDSGEILGVHIIGPEATELIHESLLAKSAELTINDISEVIHAHPTLSEIVGEGADMCNGKAIHI